MKHNHLTTIDIFGYAFCMNREKPASRIKSRLQALENDHRWRLLKTVYVIVAFVLVVATGVLTSALNSQQQCTGKLGHNLDSENPWARSTYAYSSCTSANDRGEAVSPALTVTIASVGFIAVYYLVLPRVYLYLKGSGSSKTTDMS